MAVYQGSRLDIVTDAVHALGGVDVRRVSGGTCDYTLHGLPAIAYDKGGQILRTSIFLSEDEDVEELTDWLEAQVQPRSGALTVVHDPDGSIGRTRLLVERLLPLEAEDAAVIGREAALYAAAWAEGATLELVDLPDPHHGIPRVDADVPHSAWLLYGSQASLQTAEELQAAAEDAACGLHGEMWTVPKHVRPGDLVFIYFINPIKEVRYVARVASEPFFDADLDVNADNKVARQQWWAWLTPLLEIKAIPLAELHEIAGGRVVGRAHGGTYLRPDLADALSERVSAGHDADSSLGRVCRQVASRTDLPDPATMTLEGWRTLPAARLRFEIDVERFVAEPLLRWVLEGAVDARQQAQAMFTHGVPDFAVYEGEAVTFVVEVKQRITGGPTKNWLTVPEARQIHRYMDARACPGMLIDAHHVHVFRHGDPNPVMSVAREVMTPEDIAMIRGWLLGETVG